MRGALVLHVVGGREIHHVGAAFVRHQLDAGREHELRELGAVDRRHRHADALDDLGDAVLVLGRLVGLLGGEADAFHAVAEELAKLVLGGDHGDRLAGVGEGGEDGRCAQPLRVVHHHFGAGRDVEEIVAADAVHRRRHAGDDREVVRVREARDDAVGDEHRAGREHFLEPRHVVVRDRLGDVVGLAAVDADDDRRLVGEGVVPAVDRDHRLAFRGSTAPPAASACR